MFDSATVRGGTQRLVTITIASKKKRTQNGQNKGRGRRLCQKKDLFESAMVRGAMQRLVTIMINSEIKTNVRQRSDPVECRVELLTCQDVKFRWPSLWEA